LQPRSITPILSAIVALLYLLLPPSTVRAKTADSPWLPFTTIVWKAVSPEEYHSAEKLFQKISKAGHKLPHNNLKFIWGLNRLASFYHSQGNLNGEEAFLIRSFRLQEKKLGKKNPMLAEPLKHLAHIWQKRNEYTRAKQALERALKLIEDHYGSDHFMTINVLENLSNIHDKTGQPKKAMLLRRRINKQLSNSLPDTSPAKAVVQVAEAEIFHLEGEDGKAVVLEKKALDLYMKNNGPFHLARIKLLLSLAKSSQEATTYEKAINHLKSALAISENIKGVDHPDLFHILNQMAKNYQLSGKPVAGQPFLQRSLQLIEKKHANNPDHPEVAEVIYALAENYRLNNQPNLAIPLYNRATAMLQGGGSAPPPSKALTPLLTNALTGLAHSLQTKGNIVAAEKTNRQAIQVWIKTHGPGTPWATKALNYHQELISEILAKKQPNFIPPTKKRDKIRLLQERLTNLGIDPGPIDGYSGPKTRKAIATYNASMGLVLKGRSKKASIDEAITYLPPVIP
jgi:tetratricopeptide (TPR) repeat protein